MTPHKTTQLACRVMADAFLCGVVVTTCACRANFARRVLLFLLAYAEQKNWSENVARHARHGGWSGHVLGEPSVVAVVRGV